MAEPISSATVAAASAERFKFVVDFPLSIGSRELDAFGTIGRLMRIRQVSFE